MLLRTVPFLLASCALILACLDPGQVEQAPPDGSAPFAASGSPVGNLEHVGVTRGGIAIRGWTFDPNTNVSIYVWVTVDGVGQHLFAGDARPDVAAVYPGRTNSGFRTVISAAPGIRRVCVTASNVGSGAHKQFGCTNVAVGIPFGNVEVFGLASPSAVRVRGWAIDPDTSNPIYMWVTVNGSGRHIHANQSRPDVGSAYPEYGSNHGFDAMVSIGSGMQRVCVTASNVGGGSHRSLGCVDFGPSTGGIPNSGWQRPLSSYTVTQNFLSVSSHNGIDLARAYGTTVYAARAGRIKAIIGGYCRPGYACQSTGDNWQLDPVYQMSGDKVVVQHVDGMLSIYDHCGVMPGRYVGQSLSQGAAVCRINATGNRSGAHLHFAIFAGSPASTAKNPRHYIGF